MLHRKKNRNAANSSHPSAKDFAISAAATAARIGCPEAMVANKAGKIAKDVSKSLLKEGLKSFAKSVVKAAKGEEEYRL